MSDPQTSPSETARIHLIANDEIKTRRELLTNIAVLLDRSTESRDWQKGSDEWRANHDRNDAASFAELRNDVASLKRSVNKVTSSVGAEQLNSRYTLREMVTGALLFCGSIGALIGFIGWYFSGGKP